MDSLLDYLDMMEDLLDSCKTTPFSNKISVEKEKMFELIGEIRLNLPHELRQAQRIIEEHDKILAEAKVRASGIIKEAEVHANDMASDHEIYKIAVERAQELTEGTKKSARDMRISAVDYADEILLKTESAIREAMNSLTQQYRMMEDDFSTTIDIIYQNRQELHDNKG